MPPLHTTLVEVHREYARTNKVEKDMEEACKWAMMVADCLHDQCSTLQKDNAELTERLREVEEKVKETNDHMQLCDFCRDSTCI